MNRLSLILNHLAHYFKNEIWGYFSSRFIELIIIERILRYQKGWGLLYLTNQTASMTDFLGLDGIETTFGVPYNLKAVSWNYSNSRLIFGRGYSWPTGIIMMF
jgi:hypothetical protein